jgi:hypothetical protein
MKKAENKFNSDLELDNDTRNKIPKTYGNSIHMVPSEQYIRPSWYSENVVIIVIPNSVTSVEENALRNCVKVSFVTIPNSVVSIGPNAFAGCRSLASLVIPDSVTNIASGYSFSFSNCNQLQQVIAPAQYHDLFPGVTSLSVPSQFLFK